MSDDAQKPSQELGADLPVVESPYAGQIISPFRHVKISSFWFATNFLWGALLTVMLPGEVRHIAPHLRVIAYGIFSAIAAIVPVLVPLVAGAMSDRCAHRLGRRRPYIITGVGINLIGLFLMDIAYKSGTPIATDLHSSGSTWQVMQTLFSSPSYVGFLLAFMVVQFGNNVATAAYTGFIPDLIPTDQRGKASGYMALMSQVGTLLGALGAGELLGAQSESVKYMMISTVLAAVLLVTVMGVQENPLPSKPAPIDWHQYVKSLWIDPRKFPDFAWVWITRAMVMMGFYSVVPFINYFFIDVLHIKDPAGPASMLLAVVLVFSSISGYVGGFLSDKTGRKRMVYLSNSMMAVVGLAFIVCRTVPQVLLVALLFGIGYGAYVSVDWALGADVLPSKTEAGKEMAVWHISMTLPQSIAPLVAGWLIAMGGKTTTVVNGEPLEHYTVTGYGAMFLFASLCFAFGAYFMKNVRGVK